MLVKVSALIQQSGDNSSKIQVVNRSVKYTFSSRKIVSKHATKIANWGFT